MQGIGGKPEPRSCPGIEHQCVIGLSLPSYFDYPKPVNSSQVSDARDCLPGRLPLVFAASALVRTLGVDTIVDAARMSVPIAFRTTMVMKIKDLPAAVSFTFEGACATNYLEAEKRLPGFQTVGIVGLQRFDSFLRRIGIGEQIAAHARDIEHVVHHGLPMLGRPVDGV